MMFPFHKPDYVATAFALLAALCATGNAFYLMNAQDPDGYIKAAVVLLITAVWELTLIATALLT